MVCPFCAVSKNNFANHEIQPQTKKINYIDYIPGVTESTLPTRQITIALAGDSQAGKKVIKSIFEWNKTLSSSKIFLYSHRMVQIGKDLVKITLYEESVQNP
mmetsp:Transcript_10485/g.9033  ORF Transcript_10485/g.9033 Transcript_10485/m.9033 type:complete len:102 (+) Transcript_10485:297-602(+)